MIPAARFVEKTLVNPETGSHFVLTPAEKAFLAHAFELTPDGRLKYPELVFSAPKKSGKTAFAAMLLIYVVRVLGGKFAEGICVANSMEQAAGRVFQAAARIIESSPLLNGDAEVWSKEIRFLSTGGTINAIPSDAGTAAGANPNIVVFDELWAFVSEREHRLWDELVPPPTRKVACRLTVTYAGYSGESGLLEDLYKRGVAGEQIGPDLWVNGGLLLYWTHDLAAPWQTDDWREQMREQLRPNAFLRLIQNVWVTAESTFIELEDWDSCVDDDARPVLSDPRLPVYVGVDASLRHDQTAIVVTHYDRKTKQVRLVWHKVFTPSPNDPLDFESTIEETVLGLRRRFLVKEVRYDPWQMAASSQRLVSRGVPMVEFPQTVPNLTTASSNLYDLVKGQNLVLYPDDDMRLAVSRTVALEGARGWRIAKEKASHKIDSIVALAQACLGAVESAARPAPIVISAAARLWSKTPDPRHSDMATRHRFLSSPPVSRPSDAAIFRVEGGLVTRKETT
jgi:phage terminase large subunit-like protein